MKKLTLQLFNKAVKFWLKAKRRAEYIFNAIYSPIIRYGVIANLFPMPACLADKELVSSIHQRNPSVDYELPKIVELESACVFDPRFNALYKPDGLIIESTALIRYKEGHPINAPERLDYCASGTYVIDKKMDKAIYGGVLFWTQYGHFLTETLSRLWFILCAPAFDKLKDIPILFRLAGPFDQRRNLENIFAPAKIILKQLGIYENIIIVQAPLLVENMLIPDAVILNNRKVNEMYCAFTKKIGELILSYYSSSHSWKDKQIYLSRSKLPDFTRRLANEEKLEQILKGHGYEIVHPETMPFSDQVRMFYEAREIVGPAGSAFHTLPFSVNNQISIKYLVEDTPSKTFNDIDGAMGINSLAIRCLYPHPLSLKRATFKDMIIDLRRAVNGINKGT